MIIIRDAVAACFLNLPCRLLQEPNDFWEAHLPAEDGSFVVSE